MTDAPDHPACFDASLAEMPTAVVARARLVDPLAVSHAPERVAEYRAAMRRGDRFPPIAVVRFGGRLYVADGHKRLAACEALEVETLVVEVWNWRRWGRDQAGQLARKTRQQWRVLTRAPWDASARREARRLFWDTVGHWRRIGLSLARRSQRPRSH